MPAVAEGTVKDTVNNGCVAPCFSGRIYIVT